MRLLCLVFGFTLILVTIPVLSQRMDNIMLLGGGIFLGISMGVEW